ncbi:hypothetical protein J6590_008159 [Homalodisca vitripennis]|nr:hypothetical protein J6590_008159 [Homalodisca vitripennis]
MPSHMHQDLTRVQRLSQDNRIKQRRAWLLLGWVTAKRVCLCKQPTCPAIGGGLEVTFKPLVPKLSVTEGFLALNAPDFTKPDKKPCGRCAPPPPPPPVREQPDNIWGCPVSGENVCPSVYLRRAGIKHISHSTGTLISS